MNPVPSRIPAAGLTTSFIGCVTTGSGLRSGVASTWLNSAGDAVDPTELTGRSWKSRLNSERFWVAVASIVVVADLEDVLATGS